MELIEYLRLFRRWWWLILVAAFVSGSVGFITSSRVTPIYHASSQVIIGSILSNPNPDSGDVYTPLNLTATYAELVKTTDVLQAVVDALELTIPAETLRDIVSTSSIPETSILVITARYSDPILTADIANEVSRQLILNGPTNLTQEQQTQIEIANNQITILVAQLEVLQEQIAEVDAALDALGETDAEERTRLQEQRSSLVDQINQSSSNIAWFNNTITALQQRTGSLEIIQQASIPTVPVGGKGAPLRFLPGGR